MIKQKQSIEALVEKLPEVYQPIFKHPEFSAQASRSCLDRLEKILSIYHYISNEKGRPLKVLDLGCAQGFFSLNLAEQGAIVTAVDYSQPNINVCNKLASENNQFKVEFLLGSIETIVNERVEDGEFDLVLGLSVFHHLVYEHGADFVFELFRKLSKKIETGIFEFALNTEPLYWADSQPDNPRELIDCYSFSHYLSMYGTHLSSIERPLFFASNRYWHIDDMYGVIDEFMHRSHQLDNFYHGNNRRYYFSEDKTIKIFLNNEVNTNHEELLNESLFLEKNIEGFRSAKLISFGSFEHESWMVRTTIPGRLLLDIIIDNENYDDEKIISGVLEQVSILEENGLYHNDLRPWNILIGDDGLVYIIDYGSINDRVLDGDDLYGQLLSFFVLIKEIAQHQVRAQGSQRPPYISPYDFPEKYQKWLSQVWVLPSQKWSFQTIKTLYGDSPNSQVVIPVSAMLESHLSTTVNFLNWQLNQLQKNLSLKIDEVNNQIEKNNILIGAFKVQLENEFNEKLNAHKVQFEGKNDASSFLMQVSSASCSYEKSEVFAGNDRSAINIQVDPTIENISSRLTDDEKDILNEKIFAQNETIEELRKELNLVYSCNSWKITYPLRVISKTIKLLFRPGMFANRVKGLIKKKSGNLISNIRVFVENRPFLKQRIMLMLNRNPALKHKIKKHINVASVNDFSAPSFMMTNESDIRDEQLNQNQSCQLKKNGVNEKQKSVLESWLN
ncbi:class I SAM-dependent methyltransferase [Pantoea stewartii]|uniref:class I SAM-dependent methyltransferase n=1 Tax=Pantoea stewartii TaxID=66269 RepID=UPI0023F817B5|nr:class I SAM-dependent methyltransferase [Pantoea stewartii]MDF7785631.1 class I SAM-dependent methyltransferase [Pantoea stewartii]